jgi:predicted nucleotidyltransferase
MAKRKNKRKIVPRETIIEKIIEAITELKKQIPVDCAYLFGSYARGNPKSYSDVDIAIISPEFGKNYVKETVFLMEVFHGTGLMVEPHVYSKEEFENAENNTFLIKEIIQKGIKIA